MDFKEMRNTLEKMANDNFEDFTKALISFEKGINDKESLDKIYQVYMDNDSMGLLNDEFDSDSVEIDFNIKINIEYNKNDQSMFTTELEVDVFKDSIIKNYPFEMKVILVGEFEVRESGICQIEDLAEKNSVSILFPYIRSLISTYTANSNVNTLILPPINVHKVIAKV